MSDDATAKRLDTPSADLTVSEAQAADIDRGIVRLPRTVMTRLNLVAGTIVSITPQGDDARVIHARAMPVARGAVEGQAHLDALQRRSAGAAIGERVSIQPVQAPQLISVTLHADGGSVRRAAALMHNHLLHQCITDGAMLRVPNGQGRSALFSVIGVDPAGFGIIGPETTLKIQGPKIASSAANTNVKRDVSYADIGGLGREVDKIREMIELPLRHPQVFDHIGITPPRGVLLSGPPGCGKTLIARAVAEQADASFHLINGPEIVDKHYGASEAQLRDVFEKASKDAPAIVFIDELDAIAPKREDLGGERQVERRIVAQLLTLMDGLSNRGQLVVIGATNLPNAVDPALRRPGRFDREITIPVPDQTGREEIITIHTRGMPLDPEVDLGTIARLTHGYVGADLAALAREAGMMALRRILPDLDGDMPHADLKALTVAMGDFVSAMQGITPSALREVFAEISETHWDDVIIAADVKDSLLEAVEWPLRHGDLFAATQLHPAKGAILYGPPGTGKTMIARALASKTEANFIPVSGPQIVNMMLGESEKALRGIFSKARQAAPCILFFDEIDTIAPRRGGAAASEEVMGRIVAQFLTELDGIQELRGVFVLAATNRLDRIDDALLRPGRFDLVFHIPTPSDEHRQDIFRRGLSGLAEAERIDLLPGLSRTSGWSGADCVAVCREVRLAVVRDAVADRMSGGEGVPGSVSQVHFDDALRYIEIRRAQTVSQEGGPI